MSKSGRILCIGGVADGQWLVDPLREVLLVQVFMSPTHRRVSHYRRVYLPEKGRFGRECEATLYVEQTVVTEADILHRLILNYKPQ